ncbi:hypothetical protein [Sphingomonas sp. PR090111-T3T-6A]|uniref:hypothetical protein n=1 Tax=Sphingomonas sp. PR090111-T3T-6A TaxID=685778 RepID=UPI0012F84EFF|nr:hypothetical protein [Sphingomonas sp. PR090111-T3T-6A]
MTILQAREAITGLFSDRYESHSPYLRLRPQQRDAFLSTAEIVFLAISPQSIHGRHPAAAGPVAARMPPAVARLRDRPTTVDLTRVADTDRDEIRRRLAAIDRFLLADGRRGVARTEARQLGIPKHAFYRLVRTWRSSKSPESLLAVPRISAVDPMTDSQPPRQRHMKQQNKIADSE